MSDHGIGTQEEWLTASSEPLKPEKEYIGNDSSTQGSVVLAAWRSGYLEPVCELLAEHAIFSSPATDYRGRANVAHMLRLIATVLDDVQCTGEWSSEHGTLSAFTARVSDHHLEGILRERRDQVGRIVHLTLFVRPYRALGAAMDSMRERLSANPLPA